MDHSLYNVCGLLLIAGNLLTVNCQAPPSCAADRVQCIDNVMELIYDTMFFDPPVWTTQELSEKCTVHYPAAISCLHNLDAGCRLDATFMAAIELEATTLCDNQHVYLGFQDCAKAGDGLGGEMYDCIRNLEHDENRCSLTDRHTMCVRDVVGGECGEQAGLFAALQYYNREHRFESHLRNGCVIPSYLDGLEFNNDGISSHSTTSDDTTVPSTSTQTTTSAPLIVTTGLTTPSPYETPPTQRTPPPYVTPPPPSLGGNTPSPRQYTTPDSNLSCDDVIDICITQYGLSRLVLNFQNIWDLFSDDQQRTCSLYGDVHNCIELHNYYIHDKCSRTYQDNVLKMTDAAMYLCRHDVIDVYHDNEQCIRRQDLHASVAEHDSYFRHLDLCDQETEIISYTRKEYTSGCNEAAGNLMADLMEAYLMRDILVGNCNYTPYDAGASTGDDSSGSSKTTLIAAVCGSLVGLAVIVVISVFITKRLKKHKQIPDTRIHDGAVDNPVYALSQNNVNTIPTEPIYSELAAPAGADAGCGAGGAVGPPPLPPYREKDGIPDETKLDLSVAYDATIPNEQVYTKLP